MRVVAVFVLILMLAAAFCVGAFLGHALADMPFTGGALALGLVLMAIAFEAAGGA